MILDLAVDREYSVWMLWIRGALKKRRRISRGHRVFSLPSSSNGSCIASLATAESRKIISRAILLCIVAIMICISVSGCSSFRHRSSRDIYTQLDIKDSEIRRLSAALDHQKNELESMKIFSETNVGIPQFIEDKRGVMEELSSPAEQALLPPNAKPGECFARVYLPPTYKSVTENILVQEGSQRIDIVPAEYEWGEDEVVVRDAYEQTIVVPSQYELREEQILVTPETTRVEEIPVEYVWTDEKILVRPAHTEWKKGRGPIEQVDNATGEIMCLIEIPAQYKTIRKQVLKAAATMRTIEIPAEYMTIKKNVLVEPETTEKIIVPAETKLVRMKKLVRPERKKIIPIEPQYQTVTKQVVDQPGGVDWRRVLCETNLSKEIILQIQQALAEAGHDPGPADGIIGPRTQTAIQAYQGVMGFAIGGLTFETLHSLGVKIALAN